MPATGLWRSQTAVLSDIVTLILPPYPPLDAATAAAVGQDVTRYVATQIQSMPGFLRLPYKLALFAFDWLALLRHLRTFRRLRPEAQQTYLALWSDGPLGPMRDFVKLIRSSSLLVYFDHPLVMQQLEAERRQTAHATLPQDAVSR